MVKRLFDIVVSASGLMLALPVLIFTTALVLLVYGRPVFFFQIRPGLHGKPFKMIKLRSMTDETDDNGKLLSNEKRLTKFGKFLRSTSLDELPELLNVIKGDMSLVGPRPLLMEYLPHFNTDQKKRHNVKPGITGWAQVNGRNAINWDEKLALDVWYVENQSFWLDIKILIMTLVKVLKRSDINHSDYEPMPRFDVYMMSKKSNKN